MNLQSKQVFTIGHSTHPAGDFITLLLAHRIEALADVRSFPGSRRNPQFNQAALKQSLQDAGISYHHMVLLGGKRESSHFVNAQTAHPFSAYVEYSKTERFQFSLRELEDLAEERRVAIMCAEALWTHCHRSIISKEMARHGFTVTHIMAPARARDAERSPTLPGL